MPSAVTAPAAASERSRPPQAPDPQDDPGDEPTPPPPPAPPTPASERPPAAAATHTDPAAGLFSTPALRKKKAPEASLGDGAIADDAPSATSASDAVPSVALSAEPLVRRAWPDLAERVSSVRLAAFVRQARPIALRGRALVLGVPDRLAADGLRAAMGPLLALLAEQVGDGTAVAAFEFEVEVPAPVATGTVDPDDPFAVLTVLRQESPAANRLIERFGAELAF